MIWWHFMNNVSLFCFGVLWLRCPVAAAARSLDNLWRDWRKGYLWESSEGQNITLYKLLQQLPEAWDTVKVEGLGCSQGQKVTLHKRHWKQNIQFFKFSFVQRPMHKVTLILHIRMPVQQFLKDMKWVYHFINQRRLFSLHQQFLRFPCQNSQKEMWTIHIALLRHLWWQSDVVTFLGIIIFEIKLLNLIYQLLVT